MNRIGGIDTRSLDFHLTLTKLLAFNLSKVKNKYDC